MREYISRCLEHRERKTIPNRRLIDPLAIIRATLGNVSLASITGHVYSVTHILPM
jgi:hypothetical protein